MLSKKLVAILGGREYAKNTTLQMFLPPSIRAELKSKNIDFIIASNNPKAILQYKQIPDIKVVEPTQEFRNKFKERQREIYPNLGAETRELINQYAKENNYDYVVYLDDNINGLGYRRPEIGIKSYKTIIKYRPQIFVKLIELLIICLEKSNTNSAGLPLGGFPPHPKNINVGFVYSFYAHRVTKDFEYENSTEEDIIMTIYNGSIGKPSLMIRGFFAYSKTGKTSDKSGNRALYGNMAKTDSRGTYAEKEYPNIYSKVTSYNVKNNTNQTRIMKQHKHKLKKPSHWDTLLKYDKSLINDIENVYNEIKELQKL